MLLQTAAAQRFLLLLTCTELLFSPVCRTPSTDKYDSVSSVLASYIAIAVPHGKISSINVTCDNYLSGGCGIRGESVSNVDTPCCVMLAVRNTINIIITVWYNVLFVCHLGRYVSVINVDSGLFVLQGGDYCQPSLLNALYPLHISGESRKIARFSRVAAGWIPTRIPNRI